jgi:hypothetical protein
MSSLLDTMLEADKKHGMISEDRKTITVKTFKSLCEDILIDDKTEVIEISEDIIENAVWITISGITCSDVSAHNYIFENEGIFNVKHSQSEKMLVDVYESENYYAVCKKMP